MRKILCFGDSLTYGFNPETNFRFPLDVRWTGLLQQELGNNYQVIEEGLNGRTTKTELLSLTLDKYSPLDLVILLLGTNDLQLWYQWFGSNAKTAALNIGMLLDKISTSQSGPKNNSPKILLLSPPAISTPKDFMSVIFFGARDESSKFAKYYEDIASVHKVHFFDTSLYIKASEKDGVNLDEFNNLILGKKLAVKVLDIFSK